MAFRVLMVGGGSGGHVYPLVAIARALKRQRPDTDVILMGDGPYVSRAAKEAGVRSSSIIAPKLRRYASAANILDTLLIPVALAQSLLKLLWYMPDVVLAKGGYTCAFPTFAARLYMIPVYLHESDAIPGLANRILARRSKLVFTSFQTADDTLKQLGRTTALVGNPFRAELCCVERAAAHAALKLDPAKKTILIIGGSQGAQQLNDIVLNDIVRLVQKGYNLIHQAGDRNFKDVQKAIQQYMQEGKDSYAPLIAAQYRVYPFLSEGELAAAYGAADVAISRASAGVVTELAYLGKPMVLVPLPGSANDHQAANAAELARYGAAVVDGVNATPSLVLSQVERLLDPAVAADVSARLKTFVKSDAAEKIASVLLRG
jgi:UDP-N-acetylglucosamine--N-acetylmuramyl-(pentapeptide) pyrophosphoryl-undecaprenol N-acetylglucosamine transferase